MAKEWEQRKDTERREKEGENNAMVIDGSGECGGGKRPCCS